MLQAISHPTDFSPEGQTAFVHALALAQVARCRLDLLHVRQAHHDDQWDKFPHVREVLERWGTLKPGASIAEIEAQSGIRINKIEIRDSDAVEGLSRFLIGHRPDLLVMASHGREGLNRWLSGSVSAQVAHETRVPALIFGPNAAPFINLETGHLRLSSILVPVAHDPAPTGVLQHLAGLMEGLSPDPAVIRMDVVHAGETPPEMHDTAGAPLAVRQLEGPAVEAIIAAAKDAQLIAMPTAGRQGFLDALRGSTTEQVVQRAPCPVLALPVAP